MHAFEKLALIEHLSVGGYKYELTDIGGAICRMKCRTHWFDSMVQRCNRELGLMSAGTLHDK